MLGPYFFFISRKSGEALWLERGTSPRIDEATNYEMRLFINSVWMRVGRRRGCNVFPLLFNDVQHSTAVSKMFEFSQWETLKMGWHLTVSRTHSVLVMGFGRTRCPHIDHFWYSMIIVLIIDTSGFTFERFMN